MDNEERMVTWCRMWNEDPALAGELLTDDAVQWSSVTPALDGVIGPAAAVDFIIAYRHEHINVFRPRVFVNGDESFAYTWDVTRPDGVVRSGMDVNVIRDGRIAQNWTFVGDRVTDWAAAEPAQAAGLGVLAAAISTAHRSPTIDPARGRLAALRSTDGVGSVVLHLFHDGQKAHTWSFTGTRPFTH